MVLTQPYPQPHDHDQQQDSAPHAGGTVPSVLRTVAPPVNYSAFSLTGKPASSAGAAPQSQPQQKQSSVASSSSSSSSSTSERVLLPPPFLGQHTHEVLREQLLLDMRNATASERRGGDIEAALRQMRRPEDVDALIATLEKRGVIQQQRPAAPRPTSNV